MRTTRWAQCTARQRVTRLRSAARQSLERYDLALQRFRLLINEFNCLFSVETADGGRYVLRLTALQGCHGVEETRAEIAWLNAIRQDTDLDAPRPVAMRDGGFIGIVDRDLAPHHRQHVLFEWTRGRTLGDRFGPNAASLLGRYSALLHEHARSFTLSGGRVRRFDRVFPYADETFDDREPILVFDRRFRHLYSPELLEAYEQARCRAQAATDELFTEERSLRLIHNDLHPWNVLMGDGRLAALDFEDLMWGHPVQDIATSFYYLRCRPEASRLEAAYRVGYETKAPWPVHHPGQLNALVAGRGLILANTVLASPDPEVRAKAGHYVPLIGRRLVHWLGSSAAARDGGPRGGG